MVSNAQLDNEKTNFMYQVDTLKDMLLELKSSWPSPGGSTRRRAKYVPPVQGRVTVCV